MKPFLLCTLLFLSLFSFAQTTENANFHMEYVSYNQGHIVLSVLNKEACPQEIRIKWNNRDTAIILSANELRQVMLPGAGGSIQVQAKTVSSCNAGSNGPWLSLSFVTLAMRDPAPAAPRRPFIPDGAVRVVATDGRFAIEMPEEEFKAKRDNYRHHYFILRANKPKEIIL
jgi:hypothetical protein